MCVCVWLLLWCVWVCVRVYMCVCVRVHVRVEVGQYSVCTYLRCKKSSKPVYKWLHSCLSILLRA